MKEKGNSTARLLRRCRKGVISTWFFSIFLFCTSLIMIASENDVRMMKTMLNLKTAEKYLEAECEVIHDIRCLLADGQEMEGIHSSASYQYDILSCDETICVRIIDPQEILYLEIRGGRIFDYTAERPPQDIY